MSRDWRIPVYFLLGGLVLFGAIILLSIPVMTSGPSPGAACMCNVFQLDVAIRAYAEAHDGRYPHSFADLFAADTLVDPSVLICPLSKDSLPADFPRGDDLRKADPAVLARLDALSSYTLVSVPFQIDDPDFIILYEKASNHPKATRVCLTNRGWIELLPEPEFKQRMARQLELIRKRTAPLNPLTLAAPRPGPVTILLDSRRQF